LHLIVYAFSARHVVEDVLNGASSANWSGEVGVARFVQDQTINIHVL